ncbi:photoreceptor ankyrin repeat protein isoform X2 [Brachyhypopomus gauderio]|uniref:photoreceptor ankyrin repeat protein isoform X2 n=1 Tax=Brachyhypopomus gauderio TaxID=698409 RepID=UPI0040431404
MFPGDLEDPNLDSGPDKDVSDLSLPGYKSDSWSVLSDDSFLPDYEWTKGAKVGTASTVYEACAGNDASSLQTVLGRGVTADEVMELDINGRNGLMLAVSHGFIDIVYGLDQCPFLDINHQDKDGNTALMIAAQAGFVIILNYILNYFSGVNIEVRDNRGFTALIKAAIQGNDDCVASLLMAGADITAGDSAQGKDVKEWALKTGHFETFCRLRQLTSRPCAEQFCERYIPEWPELKALVSKGRGTKSTGQRLAHLLKVTFTLSFPRDPRDNGVLDHMVRITTSVHCPLVATGCRPLCPTSPPQISKGRQGAPEPVGKNIPMASEMSSVASGTVMSLAGCCYDTALRGSVLATASKIVAHSVARRNSVFPADCVPRIRVTRAPGRMPKKEVKTTVCKGYLQPPVWKYKEKKLLEKKQLEKEKLATKAKDGKKKVKNESTANT